VQLADIRPRHLVGLDRTKFRLDDLGQNVPIEGGGACLSLRLDVLGQKAVDQLANGRRTPLGGLFTGRIAAMRDLA
jgi:hypothetical protein